MVAQRNEIKLVSIASGLITLGFNSVLSETPVT